MTPPAGRFGGGAHRRRDGGGADRAGSSSAGRARRAKRAPPIEILTDGDVRALLGACDDTTLGIRTRALIVLLYRTGLHIGEALAVRVGDVDFTVGSVAVLAPGRRRRAVGIDPGAYPPIRAWIALRATLDVPADAPLFCTERGGTLSYSMVRTVLATARRCAGVTRRVCPSGFRHTHAYELVMEGFAMPIIQRQLGHRSLANTDRYLASIVAADVVDEIARRRWDP